MILATVIGGKGRLYSRCVAVSLAEIFAEFGVICLASRSEKHNLGNSKKSGCHPPTPPIILHECQKKGLTEKAFRKLLILKDATSRCFGVAEPEMAALKEKKREQAPAL
jgi:hypothetical protein